MPAERGDMGGAVIQLGRALLQWSSGSEAAETAAVDLPRHAVAVVLASTRLRLASRGMQASAGRIRCICDTMAARTKADATLQEDSRERVPASTELRFAGRRRTHVDGRRMNTDGAVGPENLLASTELRLAASRATSARRGRAPRGFNGAALAGRRKGSRTTKGWTSTARSSFNGTAAR
jgi:hypothetical protein